MFLALEMVRGCDLKLLVALEVVEVAELHFSDESRVQLREQLLLVHLGSEDHLRDHFLYFFD